MGRSTALVLIHQQLTVARATPTINAVVQMRRRPARVAGGADRAEHVARNNALPGIDIGDTVQVRVIVTVAARTQHPDDGTAQTVLADARDDAARGRQHGRAARRKDINALMRAIARPRRTERIAHCAQRHTLHRNRQCARLFCGERDCVAPAGFDLGNSPGQFVTKHRGATLLMCSQPAGPS